MNQCKIFLEIYLEGSYVPVCPDVWPSITGEHNRISLTWTFVHGVMVFLFFLDKTNLLREKKLSLNKIVNKRLQNIELIS